jgi:hypothetical protein
MLKTFFLLSVFALFVLTLDTGVSANRCPHECPRIAFEKYDVVFAGRVIAMWDSTAAFNYALSTDWRYHRIVTTVVWKGVVEDTTLVRITKYRARTIYPTKVGEQYLMFANRSKWLDTQGELYLKCPRTVPLSHSVIERYVLPEPIYIINNESLAPVFATDIVDLLVGEDRSAANSTLQVVDCLSDRSAEIVPVLMHKLDSENYFEVMMAMAALRNLGESASSSLPVLTDLFDNGRSVRVRGDALKAITYIESDPGTIASYLIVAFRDSSEYVQESALQAFGGLVNHRMFSVRYCDLMSDVEILANYHSSERIRDEAEGITTKVRKFEMCDH